MAESLRSACKGRVLTDMLGSINDNTGGGWKVLILDELTTRLLSSSMKMSDILEANVSMVEDLTKERQPLQLVAVYFIQPTPASIARLIADFEGPGTAGPYPSVHIFFSSKAGSDAINRIKGCPKLLKVLRGLKESNMEFITIDSRTMITDHPNALVKLMGDQAETEARGSYNELDSIAIRLSTFFATINENPAIRYKTGRAPQATDPPGSMARSTLTQRLAQKLYERNSKLQQDGTLPPKTTCDMIILDRSYDPVAPIIHEWTYEALIHDVLRMEGNVYKFETEMANGKTEEREMILDESDEVWRELRHMFIAEVYSAIGTRFKEFQSKNKAAKGTGAKGEMSTGNMKQLIQALPQFREILSRLSLHIQISSDIKSVTNERHLTDVGEMEQELVFRDKNSKDLVSFIAEHIDSLDKVDRMRLFMSYVGCHPEKMDETKRDQWMKLAKLAPQDMGAICNLNYLGVQVMKLPEKSDGKGFFGGSKKDAKATIRTKREDDSGFALYRFDPLVKNIISDMSTGRLSAEDYPYIQPASERGDAEDAAKAAVASAPSARTGRSGISWAKRAPEAPGGGSATSPGSGGRKLVVFIIGGISRSEMRIIHLMSKSLGRELFLGSTSVDSPNQFVDNLYKLSVQ